MASLFGEVKEYFFSPELSAEGVLQKVKTILQINQDMFEHPNEEGKKLFRLLARTAKYFNRIDVFDHLRKKCTTRNNRLVSIWQRSSQ